MFKYLPLLVSRLKQLMEWLTCWMYWFLPFLGSSQVADPDPCVPCSHLNTANSNHITLQTDPWFDMFHSASNDAEWESNS